MAASAPAAYMPPECAAGQPPQATADVFALGLLLLQLLAASEADGLAAHAAATLESGGIERLIDPCAGAWPPMQAAHFARLALRWVFYLLVNAPHVLHISLASQKGLI